MKMKFLFLFSSIFFMISTPIFSQGMILNEDDSHFYFSRKPDEMTREGLLTWVNQYNNSRVTHLFLCPNAMKASFRSKTWDSIWDLGEQRVPEGDTLGNNFVNNARLLWERNLDPYAVWIEQARKLNISPWLSMRMNDIHNVDDPKHYLHSSFWVKHPDFWRVPHSANGSWTEKALDYMHPEVREYSMNFIQELLERYDIDGLELDWMRFGYHFKPGSEAEGRVLLNDFMKNVRILANDWAKKRNHPIQISARVPAVPDAAIGLGMDGITWANEKWVDILVPTPFWATADYNIPFEEWRTRLNDSGKKVVLAAGLEVLTRAYPAAIPKTTDLAAVYGFAASVYYRGADQIYLFNYFDPTPIDGNLEESKTLLEKGLDKSVVYSGTRRHLITYHDTVPANVSADIQLPVDLQTQNSSIKINIGPTITSGHAFVLVGVKSDKPLSSEKLMCNFNQSVDKIHGSDSQEQRIGATQVVQFFIPINILKDGWNEFSISTEDLSCSGSIVWAEIKLIS